MKGHETTRVINWPIYYSQTVLTRSNSNDKRIQLNGRYLGANVWRILERVSEFLLFIVKPSILLAASSLCGGH